jgi:predicted oxidoreductase
MTATILGIVSSVLAIVIGVWRYFAGKNRKKRELAEEAKKKLEEGVEKDDTSDITIGFDRINRV